MTKYVQFQWMFVHKICCVNYPAAFSHRDNPLAVFDDISLGIYALCQIDANATKTNNEIKIDKLTPCQMLNRNKQLCKEMKTKLGILTDIRNGSVVKVGVTNIQTIIKRQLILYI